MKLLFNKSNLDGLNEPGTHHDTKLPGLVINVTKNSKRFGVYRWNPIRKRPERVAIGAWPAWTVEAARRRAQEIIVAMDRGEAVNQAPDATTLGDLTDRYELALKATGARLFHYVSDIIRLGSNDWRNRAAASITREMVEKRHKEIVDNKDRGVYPAMRWVKAINSVYRHADLPSPAAKVRVTSFKPRARVASADEMARLRAVLEKTDPLWRDFFLISILTGVRRGNIQSMRFEDVMVERDAKGKIKGATWTIPATDAKMGEPITLPLVPEAIEIIEARRAVQRHGYVFPSDRSKTGYIAQTWDQWDEIRKEAKITGLTQHDLRRTLISRLAEAGVNPAVAAKAAGHRSVVTTLKTYTVVRQDQVLDALNQLKP